MNLFILHKSAYNILYVCNSELCSLLRVKMQGKDQLKLFHA